jgi:hypothetical protein
MEQPGTPGSGPFRILVSSGKPVVDVIGKVTDFNAALRAVRHTIHREIGMATDIFNERLGLPPNHSLRALVNHLRL